MAILDDIKAVAKAVQQAGNIDLYGRLLDVQAQIMDLLQQNSELRTHVDELQAKLKSQEKLVFKNNSYWTENEDQLDGPFCSNCWDTKQLKVRLIKHKPGFFSCPNCKNDIRVEFMDLDIGPLTINNLW